MNLGTAPAAIVPNGEDTMASVVDAAIRRYLDGDSGGDALFQALYGAALDEPIPPSLLALVRGAR